MKCTLRHILWMVSVFCLALIQTACNKAVGFMDKPSSDEGSVMLVLNTEIIGSLYAGETESGRDKMHTLRIVILHPDGTVEHNQFMDFGDGMLSECTRFIQVKQNETKTIYLIANERSVHDGLHNTLDEFTVGTDGFKDAIDGQSFSPDYLKPIPMSSVYEVEIKDESRKECQFYLVRAATKFTFRFTNMRSGFVTLNSVTVSDIADKTYLMSHKKNLTMKFQEEDGGETELFWIDWLKKISDESQLNPDDKELADKRGWIQDYDIPEETTSGQVIVKAPDDFQIPGLAYDMGVPKPGRKVYPTFYLPESKDLKNSQEMYGEQEYTMILSLTDDKNETKNFTCLFDNLKALFRNTHVVVDVTFLEKGIQVDVIPYSEVVLKPEFGL